ENIRERRRVPPPRTQAPRLASASTPPTLNDPSRSSTMVRPCLLIPTFLLMNESFNPMRLTSLAAALLLAAPALAADLSAVPTSPIAEKRELLFSDDVESAEPAKAWHRVVPTFTFENGALKGTQTRDKTIPAADGKRAVTAHAAVHGLAIPTKDSVVEARIR